MAFTINYTEPTSSVGANVYYALIVNNAGLFWNPTTSLYETYVSPGSNYAITLTFGSDVLYTTTLPDAFESVKGTVKIYKRAGGSASTIADKLVVSTEFCYRADFADVVGNKEVLEYSERLLPLLNGAGGSGLQVLGYIGETNLSQQNLFMEINSLAVDGKPRPIAGDGELEG